MQSWRKAEKEARQSLLIGGDDFFREEAEADPLEDVSELIVIETSPGLARGIGIVCHIYNDEW